uniref:Uncharacterized protein n=1 Tax=viral metagenome TaxID=1070528 RepID=A0A6C0M2E7_9ZZZZ
MEEGFSLSRGPMGRAPPRDACQEVWERGYKVVDPDLLYKTSMPCFSRPVRWPNGKRYLVFPPEREDLYINYVYGMPLYKDIGGLPQGVYTWILYKTGPGSPVQLAIAQVDSPLEIGVNHSALAMRVKATTIHGAGELLVELAGVYFNLESGTFTLNWLNSRDGSSCERAEFEEYLKAKFLERAPIAVYREKTYISTLQFTNASLELYAAAGFRIMEMPPGLGLGDGKDRNGMACSSFVGDYLFVVSHTPEEIDKYLEAQKRVIKDAFKNDTADKARFTALFSVLGLSEDRIRQLVQ